MNLPCPTAVTCPCDNLPEIGYSTELPDTELFIATGYAGVTPPLGMSNWARLTCMMFAQSATSQTDAQMTADTSRRFCAR